MQTFRAAETRRLTDAEMAMLRKHIGRKCVAFVGDNILFGIFAGFWSATSKTRNSQIEQSELPVCFPLSIFSEEYRDYVSTNLIRFID